MDAWEELADQMELVEAEEAVGKDNGVLGGFCRGLDGVWRDMGCRHTVLGADVGIVIFYSGAKV